MVNFCSISEGSHEEQLIPDDKPPTLQDARVRCRMIQVLLVVGLITLVMMIMGAACIVFRVGPHYPRPLQAVVDFTSFRQGEMCPSV